MIMYALINSVEKGRQKMVALIKARQTYKKNSKRKKTIKKQKGLNNPQKHSQKQNRILVFTLFVLGADKSAHLFLGQFF